MMLHLPGFISANVHRSLDLRKVINYAQWERVETFNASLRQPDVTAYFADIARLGQIWHP